MQLVEVELAELVDGLAVDREQQPRRAEARAVAVGAGVLDHHLVEPRLHPRVGLAALPVAPVVALDAPRDAAEADLLALPWSSRLTLASGGERQRRPCRARCRRGSRCRAVSGRSFHGVSSEKPCASARLYIIRPSQVSGLYLNASRTKQPPTMLRVRIGDEQLRMRQLVDAEPAAGAARALGIVEHEVVGPMSP